MIGFPSTSVATLNDDEALLAIGDEDKGVKHIDRLLFVFRDSNARRIQRERARKRDGRRVFCVYPRALAEG